MFLNEQHKIACKVNADELIDYRSVCGPQLQEELFLHLFMWRQLDTHADVPKASGRRSAASECKAIMHGCLLRYLD